MAGAFGFSRVNRPLVSLIEKSLCAGRELYSRPLGRATHTLKERVVSSNGGGAKGVEENQLSRAKLGSGLLLS